MLNKQVHRFLLVGISNVCISFAAFNIALYILPALAYKATISQLTSYAAGTLWSFFLNRRLTFQSTAPVLRQAIRFATLQGALAATSAALVGIGVDYLRLESSLTWFTVMICITAANFLLCRNWAFRE